jgi:hypothetical protein
MTPKKQQSMQMIPTIQSTQSEWHAGTGFSSNLWMSAYDLLHSFITVRYVETERLVTFRLMTPFTLQHCSERLCHPRWETEAKKLEKAWTKEQEKHREMNEVSTFLELSEEFSQKPVQAAVSQFTED